MAVYLPIIKRTVAAFCAVPLPVMTSNARQRRFAHPRQLAMYLCRTNTRLSFPQIGRAFGGRHHTTVMHACRAVSARLAMDPVARAELDSIRIGISRYGSEEHEAVKAFGVFARAFELRNAPPPIPVQPKNTTLIFVGCDYFRKSARHPLRADRGPAASSPRHAGPQPIRESV